ncbi:MAG: hypothetical protein L0271_26895, partial [Gemmatimonadetes bacterium]|nr:hypothetical protein [Gemmatimonadota bacterium]
MPTIIIDTLLTVRATVTDRFGNASESRAVDVVAFGGPAIVAINRPSTVRAGDVLSVDVGVLGARRVTRVTYQIRGALSKDTTVTVNPPANSLTQNLLLQVPAAVQDTVVRMMVFARDESGADGPQRNDQIPLAIDPPTVTLAAPASARAGDRMDVSVIATALRKVSEIRIGLRGAVNKDTVIVVNPKRVDYAQTVSIGLPGAITSSVLTVEAYAIDLGGALSTTFSSQVTIPVTPPEIMDFIVPGGVFDNTPADITVIAQGSRPLARIDLRWREAAVGERSIAISPVTCSAPQCIHNATRHTSISVPNNPTLQVLKV